MPHGSLLVMGAGSVGCWLGGCLRAACENVTFVGRARVLDALRDQGLTLTDLDQRQQHLKPAELTLAERIPDGSRPSLVLLCVKSGATRTATAELARSLPAGTAVVSMQNGVGNAEQAQLAAASLVVLPGMVPYNVVELAPGHYHRATSGTLAAAAHPALAAWATPFSHAGLPLALVPDLRPLQWGKLLLNLNNPVNALSGLPLREQLLDPGYRRCLAALQQEALTVLDEAGIEPAQLAGAPPRRLPQILNLPTPLFRLLARRMLRIDAKARSSMADDLRLGRSTEIDALCGEVVRLALSVGLRAPRNEAIAEMVKGWARAPRPVPSAAMWAALQKPD